MGFMLVFTPKVYSHSPGLRKSADMHAYANACHCDNCLHIFGQSMRRVCERLLPLTVSSISILCLRDIQLTFDW